MVYQSKKESHVKNGKGIGCKDHILPSLHSDEEIYEH